MTRQSTRADAIMLFIALIWGTTFIAQKMSIGVVGPFFYSASRFILGALVLLPLMFLRGKEKNGPSKNLWRDGALLGVIITIGINLQQIGLQFTTIANAGFITGLYVVIVPIIGIFLHHKMHKVTWLGVFLAVLGMYFLSVQGDFSVLKGDWFQLIGTIAWSAHVLLLSVLSQRHDPIRLSIVQFFVCGSLCLLLSFGFEKLADQNVLQAIPSILYGGLLSVGLGYTLQVFAQRNAIPSHAAIIFSMESVFAALAAWLILGETISMRAIFGCALMLAGMLIAQLVPLYLQKQEVSPPHPQ